MGKDLKSPPLVIVNADDFGANSEINRAIIRAHRETAAGLSPLLTSVSLMVTGKAVEEAVSLARQTPTLAVGLHLTLAEGWPALPPAELPRLTDGTGRLRSGAGVWIAALFHPQARSALLREMEAQFALFEKTGLPLSHVDGHLHLHVHPMVFPRLVELAQEHGAKGIRIPRDDFLLALRSGMKQPLSALVWALAFAAFNRWALRYVRRTSLAVTDRVYGLFKTGDMDEAYVARVLESITEGSAELYFHPAEGPRQDPLGPNPGDLATLLSPRIRRLVEERGLRLGTYPMLAEESRCS